MNSTRLFPAPSRHPSRTLPWMGVALIGIALFSGSVSAQINCGDCNLDGAMAPDIIDALEAARISAGLDVATGLQPCACDVDSSMSITPLDVLRLAQSSAGISVVLSCASPICGVMVNNAPTVLFNTPAAGAMATLDIVIDFDTGDVDGDNLITTIEYSTNGGALYALATSSGAGSMTTNPTAPLAAAIGQTFVWDSLADGVATTGPTLIVLRISTSDGMAISRAERVITVQNQLVCGATLTCDTGNTFMAGLGTGATPAMFDFTTSAKSYRVNTGARMGEVVDVYIVNLTDDFDLYIGLPGTPCGDTNPANYRLASLNGGAAGMTNEIQAFSDAEMIARGEVITAVVHHFAPNPTGSCDFVALCRPIQACSGSIACGDPPLAAATGSMGGLMLPASGLFTPGAMGDSYFLEIDHTGMPAGSGMEVHIDNQVGAQVAGLLQPPGFPCGYPNTYSWGGRQTFGTATDDYLLLTPANLAAYPAGTISMVIYSLAAAMPTTFDISVRCPALGVCSGTLVCGSSMVPGNIPVGTSYMFVGGQHTLGAGGDSDSFTLDLSTRTPGDDVVITLRSLTSNCDLFLLPAGMNCGWPLPWNAAASMLVGVGVNDTITLTDTQINGFGTNQLALMVYRPDPAGTGNYNISVACTTPVPGCMGTVEGVITEAITPLPQARMGNTTGANNTSSITCGFGGSVGGPDHVYQFIPSMTRTYTFSLCGAAFDTHLEIRAVNCAFGASVDCDDDTCGGMLESRIDAVPLTAGTNYYIVVDGYLGAVGAYTLNITTP